MARAAGAAGPIGSGTEAANTLGRQLAVLRRYWWVVLAVVWLALMAAVLATARIPTTYLGRTSLIVSSNDRSPDQDAVLVQGYVAYFDNEPYQQQLLAEAGVAAGATVEAQAAAASPILVISVSSSGPERAQADAIAVARVFRDDINDVHARATGAELAKLQDQLDTALTRNSKSDQAVIGGLQDRIRQLQDDQVNLLQDLQEQGGVTVQEPSWFSNLLLGLVGGLFAGILAALALATLSPRLRSAQEVEAKVGAPTLAELPRRGARDAALCHEQRMRKLANGVRARLGESGVVSVTEPRAGAAGTSVARELALEWAAQGYATVLVRVSASRSSTAWPSGGSALERMEPAVEAAAAVDRLQPGPLPGLSVLDLEPRQPGGGGLPAGKLATLLELEPLAGSLVVLEAPALLDSAAAQAASAAADVTVLVLDPQRARVPEVREALDVLGQSGAVLLGAVLAPVDQEQLPSHDSWPDDDLGSRQVLVDGSFAAGSRGWSWWSSSSRTADAAKDDPALQNHAEPAGNGQHQPTRRGGEGTTSGAAVATPRRR